MDENKPKERRSENTSVTRINNTSVIQYKAPASGALVTYTPAEIFRNYSPEKCRFHMALIRQPTDIFVKYNERPLPSITNLVKASGIEDVVKYIMKWFVNLQSFLNLKNEMTIEQQQEAALLIISEFGGLNIYDIYLVFKNAKKGEYKLYDSLDGRMILSWFKQYRNDYEEKGRAESDNKHLDTKQVRSEYRVCDGIKRINDAMAKDYRQANERYNREKKQAPDGN